MNLEDQVKKIVSDFPESKIREMLQEKLAAVPKITFWKDGYDTVTEWYRDCGNGEYDDAVIEDLVEICEQRYNSGEKYDEDEWAEMHDLLLEAYGVLT